MPTNETMSNSTKTFYLQFQQVKPRNRVICYHYKRGSCKFGDKCHYAHVSAAPKNGLKYVLAKVKQAEIEGTLVRRTFEENGFELLPRGKVEDANVYFGCCFPSKSILPKIPKSCIILHFPRNTDLTFKVNLYEHLKAKNFDFYPKSFKLPEEATKFLDYLKKENGIWIAKPYGLGEGKGIRVFKNVDESILNSRVIVSKYVTNPFLIDERKIDFRVYAAVTSIDPLKIYMYEEGLVRFASEKYQNDHYENQFIHLTNNSINCKNKNVKVKSFDENWTLSQFSDYLNRKGKNSQNVISQFKKIIIETIKCVQPKIAECNRQFGEGRKIFDLFGFDLLVDEDLHVWLLEVNGMPDLTANSKRMGHTLQIDYQVKSKMLSDLLTLVGIPINPKYGNLYPITDKDEEERSGGFEFIYPMKMNF